MEATKMTQKLHKNDTKMTRKDTKMTGGTCRDCCGPCGGSRGGPEEQGKHLHWENIGKTLENIWKCSNTRACSNFTLFQKYQLSAIYLCRPMVVYFLCSSMSSQRRRGNVNKIPSKLMLKKLMLTKYKIPSKETREEPFRFAHPRPHFRNSSPFLVDFRFLQISHHFHLP